MDYTLKVANSSGSSNQEVLDELSKIETMINNLNVDVDLSEVISKLNSLETSISLIPSTDYSSSLLEIKNINKIHCSLIYFII